MTLDRGAVLCLLAEAFQSMGDTADALGSYKKALDEAAENPNSRPRALILSSTCRSMALLAVEPDDTLWSRIHQIREGLGDPW